MSVDLTRALVPSMGQHDPLDGYISNLQLRATADALHQLTNRPNLDDETRKYATMLKRGELASVDPLGLGSLLIDAYRVQQIMQQGELPDEQLPTSCSMRRLPACSITQKAVNCNCLPNIASHSANSAMQSGCMPWNECTRRLAPEAV